LNHGYVLFQIADNFNAGRRYVGFGSQEARDSYLKKKKDDIMPPIIMSAPAMTKIKPMIRPGLSLALALIKIPAMAINNPIKEEKNIMFFGR
jgi:hypothetical protein